MGFITGKTNLDYFHVLCSGCGEHVYFKFLTADPLKPRFEYTCKKCGNFGILKLLGSRWEKIPVK